MSDDNAGHWSSTGDIPPNKAVSIKAKDSLKKTTWLTVYGKDKTVQKQMGKCHIH